MFHQWRCVWKVSKNYAANDLSNGYRTLDGLWSVKYYFEYFDCKENRTKYPLGRSLQTAKSPAMAGLFQGGRGKRRGELHPFHHLNPQKIQPLFNRSGNQMAQTQTAVANFGFNTFFQDWAGFIEGHVETGDFI